MASSVSSERAFSAAGITISKRCNRLKGDIVEALQFLKFGLLTDKGLFYGPQPVSLLEDELEVIDDDGDSNWVDIKEPNLIINVDSDSSDDN